jgi:CheY-like chemotaxis protein
MRAGPATRVALVVEDECLVRDVMVSELKASGWSVVETAAGEEVLALLAANEVDILLTDIRLAGSMNGWDVAHAVRDIEPHLPVIYASGNPSDAALRVEGSLIFSKPYLPEDIVAACDRLAGASRC